MNIIEEIGGKLSLIKKAEIVARKAHEKQTRNDSVTPYIIHPERVANRVLTKDEKVVAWLHDVIEDSELDETDLMEYGFSQEIIHSVITLTRNEDESYDEYITSILEDKVAIEVKIADILDNISDNSTEKQINKYLKALYRLLIARKKYKKEEDYNEKSN